ncbi:hypothetical protein HPB47_013322, partial [Ixodes persulcatus]
MAGLYFREYTMTTHGWLNVLEVLIGAWLWFLYGTIGTNTGTQQMLYGCALAFTLNGCVFLVSSLLSLRSAVMLPKLFYAVNPVQATGVQSSMGYLRLFNMNYLQTAVGALNIVEVAKSLFKMWRIILSCCFFACSASEKPVSNLYMDALLQIKGSPRNMPPLKVPEFEVGVELFGVSFTELTVAFTDGTLFESETFRRQGDCGGPPVKPSQVTFDEIVSALQQWLSNVGPRTLWGRRRPSFKQAVGVVVTNGVGLPDTRNHEAEFPEGAGSPLPILAPTTPSPQLKAGARVAEHASRLQRPSPFQHATPDADAVPTPCQRRRRPTGFKLNPGLA